MTTADSIAEARRLLVAHSDRALTGQIEDPAVLAAVVGVERVVAVTGSTEPGVLTAAIEGCPEGCGDACADVGVAEIVAEVIGQVVSGLERRAVGESVDAGVVNPDAGRHEIATDATLLRAGVRASQRSYDATPYYRLRYGGRGARFASTDTAWLISLADHEEEQALRHVRWLARVLANRGMPSWLLERHLGELVTELRSVAPEDAVGSLPATSESLAATRREHVGDDLMQDTERWAVEALGDDLPFRDTGLLLAAATADELAGVTNDDRPYVGWLTYPERLRPEATEALLGVRDRVRAAAR